jgi:NADPH:quinone reductase
VKAVMCKQFGPPASLVVEEVTEPVAGPGQVVVDVHGCGVNFPDVLMIEDKYQFKPALPFSPGGEVAGMVREVGAGVGGLAVGDRVLASTGWGGFAERVAVTASSVLPVPDGMDLVTASVVLTAYGTSHHALADRGQLRPGETLLVLGAAGGVGLAAVELGRAMGAEVIAAASSEAKLQVCRDHGASLTVNYATEDLKTRVKELTDGHGVDVVYDPVGGDHSEAALRTITWDGRFLVVGFASGTIPRIPLNLPLLKGCRIVGVFLGAHVGRDPGWHRRFMVELGGLWADGRIRPRVSATYPLERAAEALEELAGRRVTGKVVVVTEAGRDGREAAGR